MASKEGDNMTCMHCKGKMERGKTSFQIDRKGYHLALESVPAWICKQCGEPYFEEGDVGGIQKVISTLDEQTEKLAIAV
jgi:YgiT-type zinc finger domain-containing protein